MISKQANIFGPTAPTKILKEDTESLSSEGEGHLSLEDEDRSLPESKGKQPQAVQVDQLPFACKLCPESFLTPETLTMVLSPPFCYY
jgi:hypothetical protein